MLRACLERYFANPAKVGTGANHHGGLCVADEVFNFGTLIGRVQRQKHIACAERCQVKHHGFNRLFDLDSDAAALGQFEALQQIGHHGTGTIKIAPRIVQPMVGFNRYSI